MSTHKVVLLTRSDEQNANVVNSLRAVGHKAVLCPMVSYDIDNEGLKQAILDATLNRSYFLITSNFLAKYLHDNDFPLEDIAKIYVVGDSSAEELRAVGAKVLYVAKNANDLRAGLIGTDRTIIYMSGDIITDDFSDINVFIDRRIVYSTTYKHDMPQDVLKAICNDEIDVTMSFSIKNAENLIKAIRYYSTQSGYSGLLRGFAKMQIVAISAKVAKVFLDSKLCNPNNIAHSHNSKIDSMLELPPLQCVRS